MPELKSIKQEQFVRAYIKNKFNGTKAYQELHPNSQNASSRANACELVAKPEIQERTKEILRENNLDIENVLPSLREDISSTKPLILTKNSTVVYVPDNATRLEAKKVLLKVAGVLNDKQTSTDARQINITLSNDKMQDVLSKLQALSSTMLSADTQPIEAQCEHLSTDKQAL